MQSEEVGMGRRTENYNRIQTGGDAHGDNIEGMVWGWWQWGSEGDWNKMAGMGWWWAVADPKILKRAGEDHLSALSSFITDAHNEIYAFYTEKSRFLEKIRANRGAAAPTVPVWICHWWWVLNILPCHPLIATMLEIIMIIIISVWSVDDGTTDRVPRHGFASLCAKSTSVCLRMVHTPSSTAASRRLYRRPAASCGTADFFVPRPAESQSSVVCVVALEVPRRTGGVTMMIRKCRYGIAPKRERVSKWGLTSHPTHSGSFRVRFLQAS